MKVVEQGYRISPPYTAPKDIANLMKVRVTVSLGLVTVGTVGLVVAVLDEG